MPPIRSNGCTTWPWWADHQVDKGAMCPVNRDETPLLAQLIEERGFDPFDLSDEVAEDLASAAKARKEMIQAHTGRTSPRRL